MVILDEADRMLDMGFREGHRDHPFKQAPAERQTVFCSPPRCRRRSGDLIKNGTRSEPVNRSASRRRRMVVPAIDQVYYEVDRRSKLEVLCRLIDLQDIKLRHHFLRDENDGATNSTEPPQAARGYQLRGKLHGDI